MKKFIRKPLIIGISAVVVAGIIISYLYFNNNETADLEFIAVEKGNIVQEVSVTGKVKPAESVNLAFEKAGKVNRVYVGVGDRISAGQTLVALENSALAAQLSEAEADLENQKAQLAELARGTRPEEIQIQEVKVENAKTSLEEANRNLLDKLRDAYTKSDDAIRNKVDQFFNNPRTANPTINFTVADSGLKNELEQKRPAVETILVSWESSVDKLTAIKENLGEIKSFLDNAGLAVNSLTSSSGLSQTTIDGWKTDVSTARTNVNTAITNLTTAEEKLTTAKSNLLLEEQELILDKAGTPLEQIDAQKAKVRQSEAGIKNIQAQIAKTILYSPINGIVTKQDAKVGEIISANTVLISIISEADFQIEVDIYEEDIPQIKIGNPVDTELVAFPGEILKGRIISIDPAEKIINGVVYYEVKVGFEDKKEGMMQGMTADIIIKTASKENVLAVPREAVQKKNGQTVVEILRNGLVEEQEIQLGLEGSDGMFEVLSGLSEGDKVIVK